MVAWYLRKKGRLMRPGEEMRLLGIRKGGRLWKAMEEVEEGAAQRMRGRTQSVHVAKELWRRAVKPWLREGERVQLWSVCSGIDAWGEALDQEVGQKGWRHGGAAEWGEAERKVLQQAWGLKEEEIAWDAREAVGWAKAATPGGVCVMGFPCAWWSALPHGKQIDAATREARRGEALRDLRKMMEVVAARKPDVWILENVPHLLADDMKKWYIKVNAEMRAQQGYWWRHQEVCQWRHTGVPARRSRLWWAAVRTEEAGGADA